MLLDLVLGQIAQIVFVVIIPFGPQLRLAFDLDPLHQKNRNLIKAIDDHKQNALGDHIRRRHQRGQHQNADNRVFAHVAQTFGTDQPGLAHQRQQHRKLETQAKGHDEFQRDIKAFVDLAEKGDANAAVSLRARHSLNRHVATDKTAHQPCNDRRHIGKAQEKGHRQRCHDEMGKGRTQKEHDRRGNQERQERILFLFIKPWRHKAPQLKADHRKG
mmetsp:Transcript_23672/g.42167  ORF Transcript_23672/g.42167 Transcript_23672/m.42167 type:complete len:216 (+) Transcript_23672:423-1070(+)